ncbi:MAG: substrate-binding domain-containing protein [Prevotella sp.]|nr:substrate-binding domain-containing protein [Prevotella sp.]
MYRQFLIAMAIIVGLAACTGRSKNYRIGVSQCSDDIWRDKQNAELRMAAYFHDNVELCFAAAYDSDARQVQQIDSLLAKGIDLLIVAPNQMATISPAIDRAYDQGIPVIVFERKTNSQKYTAFLGADNYEMGRVMGDYVATRLKGRGRVLEIMGLKGSSPAIERHNGFTDALNRYPGVSVVATLQGDWTEPTAFDIVKSWLSSHRDIDVDLVFGMNDRSAMGARKAYMEQRPEGRLPLFCGIDGLPGEGGGIQLVRDSLLDASYIYPTYGDVLLQVAVDILEGRPYEKDTSLMSAIVTSSNANVLLMESEEVMRQTAYLEQLHQMATGYLQQLSAQRTVTLLAIGVIVLLLLLVVALWLFFRQRARLHQERTQMEREQLDFYTEAAHELRTPLTLIEGPLDLLAATPTISEAPESAAELFAIVRRNTTHLSGLINKILDMQAGKRSVSSVADNSGNGTAAWCEPIAMQPSASQTLGSGQQEEMPTLLIVDDNADVRAYLRSILQADYQVYEAEDGQRGLAVAREQVPDLIVSDVMMPVMNGLEFCQQVKSDFVTSHIPVILLTARALSSHQIEGYESGADAYITKPFEKELLQARITNLLHSRRVLKDLWGSKDEEKEAASEETAVPTMEAVADAQPSSPFVMRFKAVVEARLSDSNLSVEDLGADMGLSRVQLYRKVKALTGSTPVDLIRKARLAKARELLQSTDLTVSEVAYKVGFTTPSYFTKCFKDEYGRVPGDVREVKE